MKIKLALSLVLLSTLALAQALPDAPQPQSPFADNTYSFGLTPVTLPGTGTTLAGAETDIMIHITENNTIGQTMLISTSPFIGGRYEHAFPAVAKWLQDHTALTGYNYQFYVTGSLGVVKGSDKSHWGERAGLGLKWAPAGTSNFDVAFEAQANNLPGISHWIPSVAISPQFRF